MSVSEETIRAAVRAHDLYTPADLDKNTDRQQDRLYEKRRQALVSAAARAEELFDLDDLEAYAETWRAQHQGKE